jgi:HEAT repeats
MRKKEKAKRLAEYESLLRDVDEMEVPEPSAEMDRKFRATLEEAKKARLQGERAPGRPSILSFEPLPRLLPRLATAISLLVVGWFLGYQVTPRPERARLDLLASEVREMKKTVMLAMLENPSPEERMKAVQFASELSGPDESILDALTRTLNNDPDVGVRMMAVNALVHYTADPKVREALIQSIVRQKSPLVQLALADVILALNEKRAAESIRRMIASPMVDDSVKSKLETAVQELL